MKGRTPEALLRAVEGWHKRLGSKRTATSHDWQLSGIIPQVCEGGEDVSRRVFETAELSSAAELQVEGAAMDQCVATSWKLCAFGQTSIWSLTVEDASGRVDRLLTLEVRNAERRIVPVRGQSNRLPTVEEHHLLALWGDSGGPSLSRGIAPDPLAEFNAD
jgi:hypothetical protein